MIIILLAPLVAILGLLTYALSTNGKVAELGRIAFAMGLLATLLIISGGHAIHIP